MSVVEDRDTVATARLLVAGKVVGGQESESDSTVEVEEILLLDDLLRFRNDLSRRSIDNPTRPCLMQAPVVDHFSHALKTAIASGLQQEKDVQILMARQEPTSAGCLCKRKHPDPFCQYRVLVAMRKTGLC